jgi:transcriptional regulator with GAF, ATPase, and Fis domain
VTSSRDGYDSNPTGHDVGARSPQCTTNRITGEAPMAQVALDRLAEVFVEVADTLVDDFDVIDFLQMITRRARELTDASTAGLLLDAGAGRLQLMAASDEETRLLELFQLQHNEGPCLDAFTTGAAIVNADLAAATGRWPTFAPRAVAAGFRSVHALPLRLRTTVIGALNLFSDRPGTLDEVDVRVVQALADVATIGLLQERAIHDGEVLTEQLQHALNSRVVIEQAKGALARARGISVDQAFLALRDHARRNNRKLVDVALQVVSDRADLHDPT